MFKKIAEIKERFIRKEKYQDDNQVSFESVAICPKCGNHLIDMGDVYGCTGAIKTGCSLTIPKSLNGNKLAKNSVQTIIDFGYAIVLNNLMDNVKSNVGDAVDKIVKSDNNEVNSVIENIINQKQGGNVSKDFKHPTKFRCPKCNNSLYNQNNLLRCAHNNCDFKLKVSYGGLYLKDCEIETLLSGNQVKGLWIKDENDNTIKVNLKLKNFECVHDIINIRDNSICSIDNKLKENEEDVLGTIIGKCPVCSEDVISKEKAYVCKNSSNNSCSFNIEKKFFDSKIYPSDAKKLLNGDMTDKKKFRSAKKDKNFYAKIQLENNKLKIVFDK